MVDRLLEQRKPLTLYGTKHDITLPSTNQWTLLEHATSLVTPIEQPPGTSAHPYLVPAW